MHVGCNAKAQLSLEAPPSTQILVCVALYQVVRLPS